MIRKASILDLDAVAKIYDDIHTAEENGEIITGWARNVYPTKSTAEQALSNDELFVMENNDIIVAAAIINQKQVDSYKYCDWEFTADDSKVMVLHTLVISPYYSRKGFATEFVHFYENYAAKKGCTVLRIDTQEKNKAARTMYAKYGFREAGKSECVFNGIPGVKLVMLEKKVSL